MRRASRPRLLGAGANRIALALLGVLLIVCGLIVGVHVEKGETASGSGGGAAAGLASRIAASRAASRLTGSTSQPTGSTGQPTSGTVAQLSGGTLSVTTAQGATVKVKTSTGTSVTKTVKTKVKRIQPGETVTVTGAAGSKGAVSAESISVGSSASAPGL
jgi:hypothetical protein